VSSQLSAAQNTNQASATTKLSRDDRAHNIIQPYNCNLLKCRYSIASLRVRVIRFNSYYQDLTLEVLFLRRNVQEVLLEVQFLMRNVQDILLKAQHLRHNDQDFMSKQLLYLHHYLSKMESKVILGFEC